MKNYKKTYLLACEYLKRYKPITKNDLKRLAYCEELLARTKSSGYKDSGVLGKVVEVCSRPSTSRLIEVQPSKKFDARLNIEGVSCRLEVKVNGGRIGNLETIKDPQRVYVHYVMAFYDKKDILYFQDVILTLEKLLNLVNEIGCYKFLEHKNYLTTDKEKAISGDSKKLFQALQRELPFNREMCYILEDFEA